MQPSQPQLGPYVQTVCSVWPYLQTIQYNTDIPCRLIKSVMDDLVVVVELMSGVALSATVTKPLIFIKDDQ